jgi:putative transposon-encoded protein
MKDKSMQIKMEGYEVVEKRAEPGGNSARIYVPKHWAGKRVRAVRLDP